MAGILPEQEQAMSAESITTQCDSLRAYLRGFASAMDPERRQEFLSEVDEIIKLLESEHQIKKGRLTERVAVIKKLLPRGSWVHALERIAAVRDRDVRIWYPRRPAGRQQRPRKKSANASPGRSADGPSSGAEVARISRTEVIKREITEESNRRLGGNQMSISDDELATSLARLLLRGRDGVTGEDPLVALHRITALTEAKIITETVSPAQPSGPGRPFIQTGGPEISPG